MSQKAAFYILSDSSAKGHDVYACRIIEKAFINKRKIYVHTATLEEAQAFEILDKFGINIYKFGYDMPARRI